MKRLLLLLFLAAFAGAAHAQWSVTSTGVTADTVTFDDSFTGVNQGAFAGDGFTPTPVAGQLDSDGWFFEGFSDGNTTLGGTYTTGDYAKGPSAGGETGGGLYAFEVAAGDTAMGIQPTGSDWTPGTITLAAINNTGQSIDSLFIAYDVIVNNDADRGNDFNFSYAINGGSFAAVSALNYTSTELGQGSVAWVASGFSWSLDSMIADGDTVYLRWSGADNLGGGSRDEFALDNIVVTMDIGTGMSNPGGGTPTYPIADINNVDVNGVADSLGVYCYTSGVVLGVDLDGNVGLSFTLWDQEGINIYSPIDISGYMNVTQGDSLMVRGTVGQFNGLTQLEPDSIMVINSGNAIPAPTLVTSLGEADESAPRRIENFWVFDINGSNYTLVNGADTVLMRVDSDTEVDDSVSFALGDTLCYVNGIGGQFDNSNPYTDGYQLFPMFASDVDNNCGSIVVPPVTYPEYPIAVINNDDANGEPDSIGVTCWTRGVVLGVDLDGNAGLSFTLWDQEGINIFNFNDVSNYIVTEGDSLRVRGEIDFFNGLTELFVDSIVVLSSGNPIPMPMMVSAPSQMTESEPIMISNVMVIDTADWPAPGGFSSNVDLLTCNGDTITMRIDTDTDVDEAFPVAPTGMFTLRGIGGQFDNSAPYLDGYQIFPMKGGDIDTNLAPMPVPTIVINELMAENTLTISDGNGDFDDWIELFNTGTSPAMLGGLYVTDNVNDLTKYQVPMSSTASVDAGGFELLWCDNEVAQGDLHTNFTLNVNGGFVAISMMTGCDLMIVDSVTYDSLHTDSSFGRLPDGAANWTTFGIATPLAPNAILSVEETTGVTSDLKAWPNPANNRISFNRTISFTMYNLTGQVVISEINASFTDVSELQDGLYIIQTTEGEMIRVVVE